MPVIGMTFPLCFNIFLFMSEKSSSVYSPAIGKIIHYVFFPNIFYLNFFFLSSIPKRLPQSQRQKGGSRSCSLASALLLTSDMAWWITSLHSVLLQSSLEILIYIQSKICRTPFWASKNRGDGEGASPSDHLHLKHPEDWFLHVEIGISLHSKNSI